MQQSMEAHDLNLERLIAILRRRWWVIVLATLVVGGATFVFSKHQHKKYTATTSLQFQDQTVAQEAAGLTGAGPTSLDPSLDPNLMTTSVQLLTSQSWVPAETAKLVGHGLTASDVSSNVKASQVGTTDIATVSATSPFPRQAAKIANTYAKEFIAYAASQDQYTATKALDLVERQVSALSKEELASTNGLALVDREESLKLFANLQNGGVVVATPASIPTSPSSPKTTRNTALGLLFGLLLGIALVYLIERLDRRMKNVEELSAAYQLPLLATVPRNKEYVRPIGAGSATDHGDGEVFKLLRAYLRYFNIDRELRLLLVASAAPGDGKTTIAHNLAEAAQEMGTNTLLIEADLRRACLAAHYGLPAAPGLSELLTGNATLEDAIRSVPIAMRVNGSKPHASRIATGPAWWSSRVGARRGLGHTNGSAESNGSTESNGSAESSRAVILPSRDWPHPDRKTEPSLDVLVAGNPPPNPAELLQSHAMADLLEEARDNYGLVVIDTPPLAVVADAMPLLQKVDGVVLVSQLGKNTRDAAKFLRERLQGVNAPLLGVVANGVKAKSTDGYGYGYGYGYGSYGSDQNGHPAQEAADSPAVASEPISSPK